MEELLWQKVLTLTDAQRQKGNPTGNLRLTQARFEKNGENRSDKILRYELWNEQNWSRELI